MKPKEKINRFFIEKRGKCAASGILLLLGGVVCFLSSQLPEPIQAAPAVLIQEEPKARASVIPTEPESESTELEKEEQAWIPIPDELNLAHFFPEGADTQNPAASLAGDAFRTLMTEDSNWISQIYEDADLTPEAMAARLGISKDRVKGTYDPTDSLQDPNNPDTWIIRSFKNIRMTVTDGDGHIIDPKSNVVAIMAMANQYAYGHNRGDDYSFFLDYAQELWKLSHSYTVSISDVYYCSGCVGENAEERERAELELEAEAEEQQLLQSQPATSADDSLETETEAAHSPANEGASAPSAEETEAGDEAAGTQAAMESTSGVIVSGQSSAAEEKMEEGETKEEETKEEAEEIPVELSAATGSDATPANALTEEPSFAAADSESPVVSSSQAEKTEDGYCPGHVDLVIKLTIHGLDEANNNLFSLDQQGNQIPEAEEESGTSWQGWNQENRDSVRQLASKDWYASYGLSVSMISTGTSLTEEEIQGYMNALPADLSETRKKIIRYALDSVGRIPYYWGGKANATDYAGNHFGTVVPADQEGRILKGLDCSGWISWVYWSVTGNRLPYESTAGLAFMGTKISRDELKPGDIVLRTGSEAHVIMFLGWTADGKILCIHESSTAVNNVTVAVRDANWPYYRKLVD